MTGFITQRAPGHPVCGFQGVRNPPDKVTPPTVPRLWIKQTGLQYVYQNVEPDSSVSPYSLTNRFEDQSFHGLADWNLNIAKFPD